MSQPEFFAILGAMGGSIGGIVAVVYSSLQLRNSIKQSVSETLLQSSRIFEEMERSRERNSYRHHGHFAVRYLNHCEHIAYGHFTLKEEGKEDKEIMTLFSYPSTKCGALWRIFRTLCYYLTVPIWRYYHKTAIL